MNKIIEIKKPINTLYIYWTLTDFCNFKCNYCISKLHDGFYYKGIKPGFPTNEQIDMFINNLINKHIVGKKLFLIISGGEPTLHPMFSTIIDRLIPYGFIGVKTNGSRSYEWWEKLITLPNLITISLHPEFTNIEKINKIGRYLLTKNVELTFNLSCDPKYWNDTIKIYENLDDMLKPRTQPKILTYIGTIDSERYEYNNDQKLFIDQVQTTYNVFRKGRKNLSSENDLAIMTFEDNTTKQVNNISALIMNKLNNFFQWKCSAGSTGINVNFDGYVWAGICKIKNLGRIENFNLLTDYVSCNKKFCPCPADIRLNKYNPAIT